MTEIVTEPTKKGLFGKKKTEVTDSPGMLGKKQDPIVDTIPTPSTVAHVDEDDDVSVASSVSGTGKTKKKPRAEYQKQIDALTEEKTTLEVEHETIKKDFEAVKKWALSPPLKDSTSKVLDFSDAEEVQLEVDTTIPTKTRLFRKKPRAEYQAEIDVLLQATDFLKAENNRMVQVIKAVKSWAKKCPV